MIRCIALLLTLASCQSKPPAVSDWSPVTPSPEPAWWHWYDTPCPPDLRHADLPDNHRCLDSHGDVVSWYWRMTDPVAVQHDWWVGSWHWPPLPPTKLNPAPSDADDDPDDP